MDLSYKQSGAVLVIALIILLLVTIIGVSSMNTGTLELKMSSNEQDRMASFQAAQAVLDEVTGPNHESELIICGSPGDRVTSTQDLTRCSSKSPLSLGLVPSTYASHATVDVYRLAPDEGNPPRMPRSEFSVDKFKAAFLQIEATHDQSSTGAGRTKLVQGYLSIVPPSSN